MEYNQAERVLRETAKLSLEEYPKVNEIVKIDIYIYIYKYIYIYINIYINIYIYIC